jgi:hypothetical protein
MTNRSTVFGYCVAIRAASMPPIEWPTTMTRSIFSFCRIRNVFRACELKLYGAMGFDDLP